MKLYRPNRWCQLESATQWYRVRVSAPTLMVPVGTVGTIEYTPDDGTDAAPGSNTPYHTAPSGVILLWAPGTWWIRIQLAGSSAITQCWTMWDLGRDVPQRVIDTLTATVAALTSVNLSALGGTAQTGADLGRQVKPVTWTNGSYVSAGGSSTQILAARAGRRALYLRASPDNAVAAYISLNGSAAVVNSGIRLDPGNTLTIGSPDAPTAQINAISADSSTVYIYAAEAYV